MQECLVRRKAGRGAVYHAVVWKQIVGVGSGSPKVRWAVITSRDGVSDLSDPDVLVDTVQEAVLVADEVLRGMGYFLRHGPIPQVDTVRGSASSASGSDFDPKGLWGAEPSQPGEQSKLLGVSGVVVARIVAAGSSMGSRIWSYRVEIVGAPGSRSPGGRTYSGSNSLPSWDAARIWAEGRLRSLGVEFERAP